MRAPPQAKMYHIAADSAESWQHHLYDALALRRVLESCGSPDLSGQGLVLHADFQNESVSETRLNRRHASIMAWWQGDAESTGASSANLAVVPESRVESASSTTAPRTNHTRRRILITTWGSLGDLHPYVALALGLQSRGHEAILATGECYRRKIEALGIGFRAVRPDCAWVADPVVMRRLTHPRWGMIRAVQVPLMSLRESYEDTLAAAEGTDLLVGNMAAYATGIVAEKKGMPWVSAMHISDRVVFRIRSAADSWISGVFQKTTRPRAKLLGTFWTVYQSGQREGWLDPGIVCEKRSGCHPREASIRSPKAIRPCCIWPSFQNGLPTSNAIGQRKPLSRGSRGSTLMATPGCHRSWRASSMTANHRSFSLSVRRWLRTPGSSTTTAPPRRN